MLALNKYLALIVGPSGYAAIGQFQNVIQLFTSLSNGAINTGITKFIAEDKSDVLKTKTVFYTGLFLSVTGSFIFFVITFFLSEEISLFFLNDNSYASLFRVFSFTILFLVLNSFFLAVIHGFSEVKIYVKCNIAGSVISLLVVIPLTYFYELYGALLSLTIYQCLSFVVTIYYSLSLKKIQFIIVDFRNYFTYLDKQYVYLLFGFSLMAIASSILVPVTQIYIRDLISERFSLIHAGNWEALQRMSGGYMMIFMTCISVYFLPRYSSLKNVYLIHKEIFFGFFFLTIPFVFVSIFIYFQSDLLVSLLFTDSFNLINELIFYQLIGDFFKLISWLISYLMFSKGLVKRFIIFEFLFAIMLCFLSNIMINVFAFSGISISYLISYVVYFILVYFFVFKELLNLDGHFYEKF